MSPYPCRLFAGGIGSQRFRVTTQNHKNFRKNDRSESFHLIMEETSEAPPGEGDDQPMFNIEQPHSNDVLCGRGVTTNKWAGNEQFRSLVSCNKVRCTSACVLRNSRFHVSAEVLYS